MNSDQIWQSALGQLQMQMTQATFDTWVKDTRIVSQDNGKLVIGVKSAFAKDWLENRLSTTINRTVSSIMGPVELQFVVVEAEADDSPSPPESPDHEPETEAPQTSIGQEIARADFDAAWRKGFAIVSHYASYFWQPYLGQAYLLWKRLDSENRIPPKERDIRNIAFRWSPPLRYHYRPLARAIGKGHPRDIKGGEVECWQSEKARRQDNSPLTVCCGNPAFQPTRTGLDQKGRVKCLHWKTGPLEILYKEQLVAIEEMAGQRWKNNLQIQVWRLLPILTPYQVGKLNSDLQQEHERWLQGRSDRPALGELLGITLARWEQIEEASIAPLMEGYKPGKQLHGQFEPNREFLHRANRKETGDPLES